MRSETKCIILIATGIICCSFLAAGYILFFKTDKTPSANDRYFASENKTGKKVYLWDLSAWKVYKQRPYKLSGYYGDAYTDGKKIYYVKYDAKGGTKGLYSAAVNAGAGSETLVTDRLVDTYKISSGIIAYTETDIDSNKLYISREHNDHDIKISDNCGDSFAVNGSSICYYDLKEPKLMIKDIETGIIHKSDRVKDPCNISAIGESGFAVVSADGTFCITDQQFEDLRVIKYKETNGIEEDSQIYYRNGNLYYITENGCVQCKSTRTGHQATVIDLSDTDLANEYLERGYIENDEFFDDMIVISMTASDEEGTVRGTLVMAFDYDGTLIEKCIL